MVESVRLVVRWEDGGVHSGVAPLSMVVDAVHDGFDSSALDQMEPGDFGLNPVAVFEPVDCGLVVVDAALKRIVSLQNAVELDLFLVHERFLRPESLVTHEERLAEAKALMAVLEAGGDEAGTDGFQRRCGAWRQQTTHDGRLLRGEWERLVVAYERGGIVAVRSPESGGRAAARGALADVVESALVDDLGHVYVAPPAPWRMDDFGFVEDGLERAVAALGECGFSLAEAEKDQIRAFWARCGAEVGLANERGLWQKGDVDDAGVAQW